jgi:DNA (cytosine-5)-methyltransferase 1
MRKLRFIDLFAGIGGFRLALEDLGAECVFSSEIDKAAAQAYKENFGDYPAGDIKKINEKDIPAHDILCAGFPCQPFSTAGYRKGFEDTRGTLFFEIVRILAYHNPRFFILENVPGILTHRNGETFDVIKQQLSELGYYLWYQVLNAVDFGIPQNRRRVFILGFKSYEDYCKYRFSLPKIKLKPLSVILDFDISPDSLQPTEKALRNLEFNLKRKGIEPRNYDLIIASEIRPSRVTIKLNPVYFPTLTAKMGTGGNNVPIIIRGSYIRKISVREGLRLMGFPEWFHLRENYSQSYKQIGNSVVVPVVRHLSKQIVEIAQGT